MAAVLREFLVAVMLGDRETGRKFVLPNPANPILWQGEHAPPEAAAKTREYVTAIPLRRVKVGDRVILPDSNELTVDDSQVNADRVLIMTEDSPIPFILVRSGGTWKVDASPVIAGRQAAEAARKGQAAHATPPAEHPAPTSADPKKGADWHSVTTGDGRFTVAMPGEPKSEERTVQTQHGPLIVKSYKVVTAGVFWNLTIFTYPPSVIASAEPVAMLHRLAEGSEKQKAGAQREYLKELAESAHPAIEHRFRYPSGTNAEGGKYLAGLTVGRYHLVDTSAVWLFVDVVDSVYRANAKQIDTDVRRFFQSLKIGDP